MFSILLIKICIEPESVHTLGVGSPLMVDPPSKGKSQLIGAVFAAMKDTWT